MITGAIQADLAVLVISARKGEFETGFDRGGQTREHAIQLDQERFNEIQEKLTLYLKKCGFNPKSDVTYIPCSGLLGSFLKERPPLSVCSWYTGLPFLDYIDSLPKIFRDFNGPVRAIVADKYSDMGTGQNVLIMPNRTTLKLKNVEESDILSGFVICSPDAPCRTGRVFDAEVAMLELKSIVAVGYSCVLHIHAAQEEVTKIICKIDKKTGNKDITKNKFVKQDEKCILRMEATEAFCLDVFANFPQMGRFTLRDEGKTIAIGIVKKIVE
uniref:Translation elongation factor EFTu/EF1A C-terminal domain-containing protein n=1 Tax=Ditylenchus dipsaci TaxID=166011 RepID=A0A915ENV1_9BILA